DVDRFKHFNDAHGHQVGDDVLRLLGTTLTEVLNGTGIAARIGGEEVGARFSGKENKGAGTGPASHKRAIHWRGENKRAAGRTARAHNSFDRRRAVSAHRRRISSDREGGWPSFASKAERSQHGCFGYCRVV